jgi:hypothetical protein
MPHEAIQARRLRTKDTVTKESLADGLEGDALSDWLTILLITQSPTTVILTVYDPDTLQEIVWTGEPDHTVYRSAEP